MAIGAEHRSNFSAFHRRSDVYIWVIDVRVGRKPPNTTNKQISNILEFSTLKHYSLPLFFVIGYAEGETIFCIFFQHLKLESPAPWKEARQTDMYNPVVRIIKRPMGHIAHLRNRSINKQIKKLREKFIVSFLRIKRLII